MLYGGLTTENCTVGFSAAYRGIRGLTTAAHCASGPRRVLDVTITPEGGALYAAADVTWYRVPEGNSLPNKITTDSSTRFINSTVMRLSLAIGGTYCKYGKTTGFTCGTLNTRTLAPGYVTNADPTFLGIDSLVTNCLPGDSGGPVIAGNAAVGTVSGYANDGRRLIAMSMDGFLQTGISVATS